MRHHFVPQFLLQSWYSKHSPKKLFFEFRLDLDELVVRERVSKETGFRPDLWALSKPEVAGMTKQALETIFFKHIDNDAALVRVKLENSGLKSLTEEDRYVWAVFLGSMRVRQPDVINKLKLESTELLRGSLDSQPEQYEELAGDSDAPTLVEWTERRYPGLIENFGLSLVAGVTLDPVILAKIMQLDWGLYHFLEDNHDLLLGDNPCIFTDGIDASVLIVALPITPRKVFFATRGERVKTMLHQIDNNTLAIRLNESSLGQARARIYSRTKSSRGFIKNRWRPKC